MYLPRMDRWLGNAFMLLLVVCIVLFCAGLVGAQQPAIAPPALDERVTNLERRVSALERSASAKPIAPPADDPWARPDGFKATADGWRDVRSFNTDRPGGIDFYGADGQKQYATVAWVNDARMPVDEFQRWAARNAGRVQYRFKPQTYGECEFQIKIPTGDPLRGLTSDELKQIDPWYRQSAAPVYSAPVVVQAAPVGWTGAAVTYNADGSVTTCSNGSCSTSTPPQRRGFFRR
jgi:hypothetical protein